MLSVSGKPEQFCKIYREASIKGFFTLRQILENNLQTAMFFLGVILLHQGLSDMAYAGSGSYSMACNGMLSLVEGTFGALVTSVAGIAAIVASAMGGFKMAWALVVVAVGAFILRSYITLFNGDCGAFAAGAGFGVAGGGGFVAVNPGGVAIGVGF